MCRIYGSRISTGEIRRLARTDLQGTSISGLKDAASALGFEVACGRLRSGALSDLPLPAVLLLPRAQSGHFVVLVALGKRRGTICDPRDGVRRLPLASLGEESVGAALILRPGPDFQRRQSEFLSAGRTWVGLIKVALAESRLLLGALFASLVTWGLSLWLAHLGATVFDAVLPKGDLHVWAIVELAGLATALGLGAASLGRGLALAAAGSRLSLGLGGRYLDHLARIPLPFLDRVSPADLVNRSHDVESVRRAVAGPALSLTADLAAVVCAGGFLAVKWPLLTCLVAVLALPLALASIWAGPRISHMQREARSSYSDLVGSMFDAVANYRLVKAYGAEAATASDWRRLHASATAATRKLENISSMLSSTSAISTSLMGIGVLLVGARLAIEGRASAGTIVFYLSLAGVLAGSLSHLVPSAMMIERALVSLERVWDIEAVEAEPVLRRAWRGTRTPEVAVRSASFSYGTGRQVLRDVSLVVSRGESVAVLGETGCGKSTLGCIIAGLYLPEAGTVEFDGVATSRLRHCGVRPPVGVVFQDGGMVEGSVADNIKLGRPSATLLEIAQAAKLARAEVFIRSLPRGYAFNAGSRGTLLSGGQRQRIALARAFLSDDPIMVLDEATSNLDMATECAILRDLLAGRKGKTTIIITHRGSTAEICDRAIVLAGGRVVQDGCLEDLAHGEGEFLRLQGREGAPESRWPARADGKWQGARL